MAGSPPHAWALDGFAELVRENGTIVEILPELGVLAAMAAVLLALATWRLRRVHERLAGPPSTSSAVSPWTATDSREPKPSMSKSDST